MNKVLYAVIIGYLIVGSITNCYGEWESSYSFKSADKQKQKEAYIKDVVDPAIQAELNALKKEEESAEKQRRAWVESYNRRKDSGQDASYESKQMNWYRKLEAQAHEDSAELEEKGESIALGQASPDNLSEFTQQDLREKLIERENKFNDFLGLTPEEVEEIVGSKKKSSGAFFSPLEEEKPSVWDRISSWFAKKQ